MRLMSDETRAARQELRAARAELNRVAAEDAEGYRWWQQVPETDAFLAANARMTAAEQALPWWQRIAAVARNRRGERRCELCGQPPTPANCCCRRCRSRDYDEM
jgi:hypothetical protein